MALYGTLSLTAEPVLSLFRVWEDVSHLFAFAVFTCGQCVQRFLAKRFEFYQSN